MMPAAPLRFSSGPSTCLATPSRSMTSAMVHSSSRSLASTAPPSDPLAAPPRSPGIVPQYYYGKGPDVATECAPDRSLPSLGTIAFLRAPFGESTGLERADFRLRPARDAPRSHRRRAGVLQRAASFGDSPGVS